MEEAAPKKTTQQSIDDLFLNKMLRLKELSTNEIEISYYDPQDFKAEYPAISSGRSSSVYTAYRKNSTKYAIKRFFKSSMKKSEIRNEIYLTGIVASHPNIIQFYGVTKLEGDYSLVLEYADSGTLGKYLKDNSKIFKWESQLKFAKEIADAILWLHDDKKIIHGDLHSNNVLIHRHTIKLADFGRSRSSLQGSDLKFAKTCGVIPYMDPKLFNIQETENDSYNLTKKSDIYSLGVLFWQLTSCSSPFDFETKLDDHSKITLKFEIFYGRREDPILNTNGKFVELYQKCWRHESDERPVICQVISELNSIDSNSMDSENNNKSIKSESIVEKLENEDSDLTNNVKDCDVNKFL